jgi:hypothetical protein
LICIAGARCRAPVAHLVVRADDMRSKLAFWTLCLHAGLLVVAATRFTVLSWIWGNYDWTWNYFQYTHRNGWGYQYQSEYPPLIVLTYIAAYLAGIAGYALTGKRVHYVWTGPAAILSALGLISFLIEGSHWRWSHHLSWIVSCPAASLVLAGVVMVALRIGGRKPCTR